MPSATAEDNRKWTVMVFMGAATMHGNAPLVEAALADITEMGAVGSGDKLNIFVQVHGIDPPRRFHIKEGATGESLMNNRLFERPDLTDTSGGRALEDFIVSALACAKHSPADHSMLVLWGHAYDFALGRERTREGTIDALDFAELSDVLKRLQKRFGAGSKVDVLGFDACDLATVEMACQLEPFAHYLLGSQIGIPIPGWPYDRILERLRNPQGDRLMVPAELGSYAVRRFCEAYPPTSPVSLTLLDLNRACELFAHAEVLAMYLASALDEPDSLDQLAQLFYRSQTDEDRPYVDLADLCLTLGRESGGALVVAAARALGDFLIGPRPPLVGRSAEGAGRPFVAEHGRNAGHTARLNGISIYAPHVAPGIDFEAARPLYQNFAFAQGTRWSELVHALARLE